jgi:hypothetical protein
MGRRRFAGRLRGRADRYHCQGHVTISCKEPQSFLRSCGASFCGVLLDRVISKPIALKCHNWITAVYPTFRAPKRSRACSAGSRRCSWDSPWVGRAANPSRKGFEPLSGGKCHAGGANDGCIPREEIEAGVSGFSARAQELTVIVRRSDGIARSLRYVQRMPAAMERTRRRAERSARRWRCCRARAPRPAQSAITKNITMHPDSSMELLSFWELLMTIEHKDHLKQDGLRI